MSEDFKVLYSSKDAFVQMYMTKMNSWSEQLGRLEEKMNAIVQLESFQGDAANSVKSYISDVYPLLLLGMRQTMYEFLTRLSLYSTDYYNIEDNIYAQINKETLESLKTEARNEKNYLAVEFANIQTQVSKVSDLLYLKNPSQEYLSDALEDVAQRSERLAQDIVTYERNTASGVDSALAPLISSLYATINEFLNNRGAITEYNAGDYGGKVAVHDLVEKLNGSITYTAEKAEDLDESMQKMNDVAVQKQKDYEAEMERLKKDEGLAKTIQGALTVIGAAVIIIGTAGAATPVVVVACVSGGFMAAYGLAETTEGVQEFVTGQDGWNPIRDTVFQGEDGPYHAWGKINSFVAGMCVPVGKAVNSVAGASGTVVAKKVAVTVGKEAVTEVFVDGGKDVIVNYVDDKVDLSATEKVILEQVVETGLDKGVDFAEGKVTKIYKGHEDADFTDKMSYDDAKRYNEFWADRASETGEPGYEGFNLKKPDADVPALDTKLDVAPGEIDAAIERNSRPDAYSDDAYNAEHYYDDFTDADAKQLEDNDFGAVNDKVFDYEHPEYVQEGKLKVDWGSDAVGHTEVVELPAGTRIIQYSYPDGSGSYFAPEGTEYADLQLPDVEGKRVMTVYEVQEGGLKIEKSEVAIQPWNRSDTEYGGNGATQYKADVKAEDLVNSGILKPVNP